MPGSLVVFDLDGTLVDSSRDLAGALNAALARTAPGTPPLPLQAVRSMVGDGARCLVERALARTGLAQAPEQLLAVFLECYQQRLLETTTLYPGIQPLLERLRRRSRLAVLSNKPGAMSRRILAGLGVAGCFDRVYGGDDLAAKKPDPVGLVTLLAELEVAAADAALVGDSAVDVRTGRAAGVRTIGVAWGFDPAALRLAGPDVWVADAGELGAALAGGRAGQVC